MKSIADGLGLDRLEVLASSFCLAILACMVISRIRLGKEMEAQAPGDNPCHSSGVKLKLGGIVVVGSALAVSTLSIGIWSEWRQVILFLGSLFLIGVLDDFNPLTPGWKIILQLPITSAVVLWIPRPDSIALGPHWALFEIAWVIILTNAFNIIDIADGFLTSVSSIILFAIAPLLWMNGYQDMATIALAFAASLVAFLFFNLHEARLILGDAGSLTVGGMIALLSLYCFHQSNPTIPSRFFIPLLATMPVWEVVWVSYHRIKRGIPPWRGSPHHFIYWVVKKGLPVPTAVALIGAAQLLVLLPWVIRSNSLAWFSPAFGVLALLVFGPGLKKRLQKRSGTN